MTTHQIQLFVDRSGVGVNWRLLAANHRETGRGTRLFADERVCRDEVRKLQDAALRLVPRTCRAPLGRWSWELSLDGTVVVASIRSFDRLIRCEQVLVAVAERFGTASVAAGLVDSGARRRGLNRPTTRLEEYA